MRGRQDDCPAGQTLAVTGPYEGQRTDSWGIGEARKMSDEIEKPRWGIAPFFVVADVVATANYYRDQLGFHYERFWNTD